MTKTYNSKLKFQASDDKEAQSIIESLSQLASKLSAPVLKQLADVVSNPIKLAFAKKQLGID